MRAKLFVPIRKDGHDGHLWMDTLHAGVLPEIARAEVAKSAELVPAWDEANPVQRIARCVVIEEASPIAGKGTAAAAIHQHLDAIGGKDATP